MQITLSISVLGTAEADVNVLRVWLRAGWPDDRCSIPGRGERIFPVASVFRPALGPTQTTCTVGTGGPFPGAKARPGRDTDHSLPHLVPRSRMSRSYTSCQAKRLRGV
jgi:hypothetical protein